MSARVLGLLRDRNGAVMLEFVLVLPMLLVAVLGLLQFGLFYFQYTTLTDATAAGARQFSIGRLNANAYSDTVSAIEKASCNLSTNTCTLTAADMTITLATCTGSPCSGNMSPCTSNSTCQSNLATAYSNKEPISVTVSYACTILMPTSWVNLTGICPLTMTLWQRAQ
jgi:Flp pilus assembly protein TadG